MQTLLLFVSTILPSGCPSCSSSYYSDPCPACVDGYIIDGCSDCFCDTWTSSGCCDCVVLDKQCKSCIKTTTPLAPVSEGGPYVESATSNIEATLSDLHATGINGMLLVERIRKALESNGLTIHDGIVIQNKVKVETEHVAGNGGLMWHTIAGTISGDGQSVSIVVNSSCDRQAVPKSIPNDIRDKIEAKLLTKKP